MEWFRWYHGAISDPKWPLIARKSGQNIGTVVSVWAAVLEYASQADERGCVDGFNPESVDALFGYEDGATEKVVEAMKNQGVISVTPCNANETHDVTGVTLHVVSWEKRQVKRERDDNSLERVRAHRMKKKAQQNEDVSKEKPAETPCNASVTPRNAQNRTEQRREENKNTPLTPQGDDGDDLPPVDPPQEPPAQPKAKKRTRTGETPLAYSPAFESAWKVYPCKSRKGSAWAAWQKALLRGMQADQMPEIITARAKMHDWQKEGGQYVPHFATWLNANGWEDEVAHPQSPPSAWQSILSQAAVN